MTSQNERLRPAKKPELTDADKALLEAQPDWERIGQGAKRLLSEKPDRPNAAKAPIRRARISSEA